LAAYEAKLEEQMRPHREAQAAAAAARKAEQEAFEREEAEADRISSARYEAERMNWEFDHPREAALVREYHEELKEGKWPLYAGKRPDWQ
jgi:hypothetical protein